MLFVCTERMHIVCNLTLPLSVRLLCKFLNIVIRKTYINEFLAAIIEAFNSFIESFLFDEWVFAYTVTFCFVSMLLIERHLHDGIPIHYILVYELSYKHFPIFFSCRLDFWYILHDINYFIYILNTRHLFFNRLMTDLLTSIKSIFYIGIPNITFKSLKNSIRIVVDVMFPYSY